VQELVVALCGRVRNFHGKLTGKYKRVRTGFSSPRAGSRPEDKLAVLRELHRRATFDTAR
jgi:hypothetical protein